MAPAQSSAAQAGPSARALELMDQLKDQKSPVRKQLCIALHRLNMAMVTEHLRPLTQIWLPGFTADGAMALTCDCAPYAIGGDSDLCSLFRCVSCRYTFRPTSTHKQGSIGRVFVTHQPEVCSNLGEAPTHIFHRAREAKECLLRSMCTMPLWVPEITKNAPMAVIEILLPEQHPDFEHLHELTSMALQSVTETLVTIHASTAAVLPSQLSRDAAASSGPDEANPAQRGRTLARSMREGNSWEGSGASPGMPPDHAWHARESPPHDHAGRSGRGLPLQDVQGATKPAPRSLPVQLSGNSSATPTSVHTPETQTTTGATTAPLSEELVVGFRRSSSPPHRATAGSGLGPGAVSGLASIAGVDRVTSAMQRMQPIKAEPPPPQQAPTLTQTSARHAQELQEAAQQRVLAFVHAQAQARANNAAAGLDMLSLTTPTSGELTIDGHLTTPAGVPAQRTSGHCTHSGFSNSGDVVNASGELATLADGGLKNTSGQLGIPSRGVEALHLDGVHKAGAAAAGSASGQPGDALRMHDIDNDLFGNGWGLGDALGDGEAPDCQGHVHSRSAALHRGLSSMMQMPNTIHRPRLQPFASSPAGQQDRRLSPSPQARRLRHMMEEETCTLSEGNEQVAHVNARDSASESVLLTALQSESNKYVIQKVFSEADLDADMTDGVRARKKRISPGPGQRSSGGLPDMPGPSTALPFLPDLNEQPSMPQSADAVLGTGAHSGSALTSPPGQGGNGGLATAAAQRGSPQSHSPQYDAQLRQFVHPGVRGGRETFVRVGHSAAPKPLQDSSYQHASSSPFTAVAGQPRPNAGKFWKVPAQAQGHSQGDGEGGKGGPTGTGAPGYQSSNLMGAHVMYQSYANDVKALRSKVNRVDGGIGRKVTLDVLKRQFGKGLKEAADNLGMCPTTLKRACRRLGVKRWPRTAEAANQALLDAEAMQREHSAVGHSDDDKEAAT